MDRRQKFSAKDVEFTYQKIIDPAIAIRSRSGFDLIKNFKVVDDTHLEIELTKVYVPFLWPGRTCTSYRATALEGEQHQHLA